MHKDELLQLHSLLSQMKRFFEESGIEAKEEFQEYEDLRVSPQHIHKSKTDHKRAVFMLGKGLTELVIQDDRHLERMRERFLKLASVGAEAPPSKPAPAAEEPAPATEHLPAFALAALSR